MHEGIKAVCIVVGLGLAALLSGCATGEVAGQQPSSTVQPPGASDKPEQPIDEATSEVQAVVVVAGVDVDGEHVSASGYAAGTIEDGGACTFRFTQDDVTMEVTSVSVADRVTSSCGVVQAPAEDFARGTWSVRLSYVGGSGESVSEPVEFEVP